MNKMTTTSTVFVLLVFSLVLAFFSQIEVVQATTYNIIVEVLSPIQNKTYFTNNIPLSFNYSTNMDNLPNIEEYSVVFVYNLDRKPHFDMFGNPVFWGNTTRIGQFDQPIPLEYNSSIHVPNGNHSLFVYLNFWITPEGEHTNIFDIPKVSQVVNFTVSAETTPSPTLSPSITPSPTPTPLPPIRFYNPYLILFSSTLLLIALGILTYYKKYKK